MLVVGIRVLVQRPEELQSFTDRVLVVDVEQTPAELLLQDPPLLRGGLGLDARVPSFCKCSIALLDHDRAALYRNMFDHLAPEAHDPRYMHAQ